MLSAMQTVGVNQFKQWLKNGVSIGTEPTVTVTMDYDRTLRAVYEPKPVTLTVASRDPDSGVTVTVSPTDNNGQAGGTTQFTRVYSKGTEVTLTTDSTSGSNQFKQWLANGVPAGTNPTVTVIMDYDRTLRAVYEPKPVTLTVVSRDPDSGVTVTVSPADRNGQAGGTTQFTRVYSKGTEVTLSAKQSAAGNQFKEWLKNGEPAGTEPTVTVTMDYDRTLRAVYEPIPVTLTVASRDPDSGITVTVSPADQNGQAGGTTQFIRIYSEGTEVTLTAEQTVGANQFKQWLKNGESVGTNPTVTVTMDYDRTLRAVYEPGLVVDPTLRLLVSRVLSNKDQITIQAVGKQPFEMVELELSYDLIHWETQDLQLPISLPLSFPLAQDMQFMRVKRIRD